MRGPAAGGVCAALVALAALAFVLALLWGARDYPPALLWQMFDAAPPSPDLVILREMRLPRAVAAVLVGGALAVAGGLMQALTRNPLADPGLTGVNAGAALAVVLGLWLFGPQGHGAVAGFALCGAGAMALIVRLLVGRANSPLRLPLAGAALSSFCMAVVSIVVLLTPETRAVYRFWMVGSLAQADPAGIIRLAPMMLAGAGFALLVARPLEALMLGEEMGQALGMSVGRVLALSLVAVALLAGGSVALAGPVGFVGLIAPHVVRRLMPHAGLPWQIVAAMPAGAALVLLADLAGRRLVRPEEWPVGIMLALIGAPVFLWMVRAMVRQG